MNLLPFFYAPLQRLVPVLLLTALSLGCTSLGGGVRSDGGAERVATPNAEVTLADGPYEDASSPHVVAAVPASLAPGAEPEEELSPPDPTELLVEGLLAERAQALAPEEREHLTSELMRAQRVDGLPALLLLSLIDQESRFDPKAKGPRGALGLMQIRPFVAADVSYRNKLGFRRTRDLYDPLLNVRIGIAYLRELQEEFSDLELALAAYHIGPTRVRHRARRGWRPKGPYVRTVMTRYEAFQLR